MADPMVPRQRTPFRGFIYRLLERNGIPNPPKTSVNTSDEVWGYFIEQMSLKSVSTIISNLSFTGGYVVSEMTASLTGNTVTVVKTHTSLVDGTNIQYPLNIVGGTNVIFTPINATTISVAVPSVGTSTKFTSTDSGSGIIGNVSTAYVTANLTPFNVGDILSVGSIVYLSNNYTVEVVAIDSMMGTYTGVVIEVPAIHPQADWNETNTAAEDYIKNKPNIAAIISDITTIQNNISDIESGFGDGYFVKELTAAVNDSAKTIVIEKTHSSINPADPTKIYPLTIQGGNTISFASGGTPLNPVVTVNVDTATGPIYNVITTLNNIVNQFGDGYFVKELTATLTGQLMRIEKTHTSINPLNPTVVYPLTIQAADGIHFAPNAASTPANPIIDLSVDTTSASSSIYQIIQDLTQAQTDITGKVDKVAGKGLSTQDYTTADQTKLGGIAAGAEVNVQSDWNETDPTKDSFILNKPGAVSTVWGAISGTLSNQTDLATALNNKVDIPGLTTNYGDAYFVKELLANVDVSSKSIEIIKTHSNLNTASANEIDYPLTLVCGTSLTMALSGSAAHPVVTIDANLTSLAPKRMEFTGDNPSTPTVTLPVPLTAAQVLTADVYVNGLLQKSGEYTLTTSTFTFTDYAYDDTDDIIIKYM
jgi:hypothetical protein